MHPIHAMHHLPPPSPSHAPMTMTSILSTAPAAAAPPTRPTSSSTASQSTCFSPRRGCAPALSDMSPTTSCSTAAGRPSGRRFWETVLSTTDETVVEDAGMNIPCMVCGVRFRKPGHLNMHWRSVHADSSDGDRKLQAPRSTQPVLRVGKVNKPVSGRAYGCPQCDARFRRGSDRNRHMRMVHAKIRPFECAQCGNHFGRKSFLEAHVLTVHDKLRPFQCDCGAAFGQRSSLTRHIRKIHGREP